MADGRPDQTPPRVVILAGPNGAGKSTAAKCLLLGPLAVAEFVNADTIAAGLSAFSQDRVALEAGRVMRTRLRQLAAKCADFAFETTLATRSYAPWLRTLSDRGYEVHLVFIWLRSPELACARVAERVAAGGHDIPDQVVHRRYRRGLHNLRELYLPIADTWRVIDNTRLGELRTIAVQRSGEESEIHSESIWRSIKSSGE